MDIVTQSDHPCNLVEFKKVDGSKIPTTTSLIIAKVFDKEHKHVIRDVEILVLSNNFNRSNFGLISYKDIKNRKQPMYILDETFTTVLIK